MSTLQRLLHTCVQGMCGSLWSAGTVGSVQTNELCGTNCASLEQAKESSLALSEVSQPLRRSPTAKIKYYVNPRKDVMFSCPPVCSVHPYLPRSSPPTWMKASGEKQTEANQPVTNIHHIRGSRACTWITAGKKPSETIHFTFLFLFVPVQYFCLFILPERFVLPILTSTKQSFRWCEKASRRSINHGWDGPDRTTSATNQSF